MRPYPRLIPWDPQKAGRSQVGDTELTERKRLPEKNGKDSGTRRTNWVGSFRERGCGDATHPINICKTAKLLVHKGFSGSYFFRKGYKTGTLNSVRRIHKPDRGSVDEKSALIPLLYSFTYIYGVKVKIPAKLQNY